MFSELFLKPDRPYSTVHDACHACGGAENAGVDNAGVETRDRLINLTKSNYR